MRTVFASLKVIVGGSIRRGWQAYAAGTGSQTPGSLQVKVAEERTVPAGPTSVQSASQARTALPCQGVSATPPLLPAKATAAQSAQGTHLAYHVQHTTKEGSTGLAGGQNRRVPGPVGLASEGGGPEDGEAAVAVHAGRRPGDNRVRRVAHDPVRDGEG